MDTRRPFDRMCGLFAIADYLEAKVVGNWIAGRWALRFRRSLGTLEALEFIQDRTSLVGS